MKVHYTIYHNYTKKAVSTPICNDTKRIPQHFLTQDQSKVTCKNCIRSMIASSKLALDIAQNYSLFDEPILKKKLREDISYLSLRL